MYSFFHFSCIHPILNEALCKIYVGGGDCNISLLLCLNRLGNPELQGEELQALQENVCGFYF